jgi:hypothetical protein
MFGKMGIFGDILAPLKDIIHGLQYPITEVERIFGTVITITKDIINELVSLVTEIENLFNGAKFEELFVTPFKDAVLTALHGIDSLTALIFNYGQEDFADVKTVLEDPIKGVYALVSDSIHELHKAYTDIINHLTPGITRVMDNSMRDVHLVIARIDDDISLIKQEVKVIFRVTTAKATAIEQDFVGFAKNGVTTLQGDVNKVGTLAIGDASVLLHSIENRLKNESGAIDAFIGVMVVMFVVGVIGIYLATHSISLVIAAVMFALVSAFTVYYG